jgi:hypothetical protein
MYIKEKIKKEKEEKIKLLIFFQTCNGKLFVMKNYIYLLSNLFWDFAI